MVFTAMLSTKIESIFLRGPFGVIVLSDIFLSFVLRHAHVSLS